MPLEVVDVSWLSNLAGVFVPLLVATSPLAVLPIFLGMTEDMAVDDSRHLARGAVLTGFVIAMTIVVLGDVLFSFLGITVDDLRVAGGLILLLISVYDLVFSQEKRRKVDLGSDAGVVPLGTPLIVGPATMTTCVVLADVYGKLYVAASLTAILLATALMLHHAHRIKRVLRPAVTRAFGKVMSLFLAAIAVAMLRAGIASFIDAAPLG